MAKAFLMLLACCYSVFRFQTLMVFLLMRFKISLLGGVCPGNEAFGYGKGLSAFNSNANYMKILQYCWVSHTFGYTNLSKIKTQYKTALE